MPAPFKPTAAFLGVASEYVCVNRAWPVLAAVLLLSVAACSDGRKHVARVSWLSYPLSQPSPAGKRSQVSLGGGQQELHLTLRQGVSWNGCALADDTDWNDLPASRCDDGDAGADIVLGPGITMADGCLTTASVSVAQVKQGVGVICPVRVEASAANFIGAP